MEIISLAKTINDAIYLRGLFIHRYSGIEFAVSELILRAKQHPAYGTVGNLPFPFNKKLRRLYELIEADGPIKLYKEELVNTFGNFTEFAERRDFMVHGIMEIPKDTSDYTVLSFRMYNYNKVTDTNDYGPQVCIGRMEATLDQLQTLANDLQPISTNFTALVARICHEVLLPPLYEHI